MHQRNETRRIARGWPCVRRDQREYSTYASTSPPNAFSPSQPANLQISLPPVTAIPTQLLGTPGASLYLTQRLLSISNPHKSPNIPLSATPACTYTLPPSATIACPALPTGNPSTSSPGSTGSHFCVPAVNDQRRPPSSSGLISTPPRPPNTYIVSSITAEAASTRGGGPLAEARIVIAKGILGSSGSRFSSAPAGVLLSRDSPEKW